MPSCRHQYWRNRDLKGRSSSIPMSISEKGLGAVLSQVQDGMERVVAYASRSLRKPEKNYCVTWKELAALMFGIKKFKAYLDGRPVRVRTDHSSLQCLTNFKEPEGQVARWLEQLAPYDLHIEHRPGRKHGNADGLSRRPCKQCGIDDLEPEVSNSLEKDTHYCRAVALLPEEASELRVKQTNDEMCQEFVAGVEAGQRPPKVGAGLVAERRKFWSEFPRLIVKEGLLCREWVADDGSKHWQCYVPEVLRRPLFDEVHAGRLGGHLGFDKTLRQLRLKFFWPGMSRDVQVWCAACRRCQSRKGPSRKKRAALQIWLSRGTWDKVSMDILGPLPRTARKNKYILVGTDTFTKFVEAFPIPDLEAQTSTDVIVRESFAVMDSQGSSIRTREGRLKPRWWRPCVKPWAFRSLEPPPTTGAQQPKTPGTCMSGRVWHWPPTINR